MVLVPDICHRILNFFLDQLCGCDSETWSRWRRHRWSPANLLSGDHRFAVDARRDLNPVWDKFNSKLLFWSFWQASEIFTSSFLMGQCQHKDPFDSTDMSLKTQHQCFFLSSWSLKPPGLFPSTHTVELYLSSSLLLSYPCFLLFHVQPLSSWVSDWLKFELALQVVLQVAENKGVTLYFCDEGATQASVRSERTQCLPNTWQCRVPFYVIDKYQLIQPLSNQIRCYRPWLTQGRTGQEWCGVRSALGVHLHASLCYVSEGVLCTWWLTTEMTAVYLFLFLSGHPSFLPSR